MKTIIVYFLFSLSLLCSGAELDNIQIELQTDRVKLTWESIAGAEYIVWASDDMETWYPADTISTADERLDTMYTVGELGPTTTAYVPLPNFDSESFGAFPGIVGSFFKIEPVWSARQASVDLDLHEMMLCNTTPGMVDANYIVCMGSETNVVEDRTWWVYPYNTVEKEIGPDKLMWHRKYFKMVCSAVVYYDEDHLSTTSLHYWDYNGINDECGLGPYTQFAFVSKPFGEAELKWTVPALHPIVKTHLGSKPEEWVPGTGQDTSIVTHSHTYSLSAESFTSVLVVTDRFINRGNFIRWNFEVMTFGELVGHLAEAIANNEGGTIVFPTEQ